MLSFRNLFRRAFIQSKHQITSGLCNLVNSLNCRCYIFINEWKGFISLPNLSNISSTSASATASTTTSAMSLRVTSSMATPSKLASTIVVLNPLWVASTMPSIIVFAVTTNRCKIGQTVCMNFLQIFPFAGQGVNERAWIFFNLGPPLQLLILFRARWLCSKFWASFSASRRLVSFQSTKVAFSWNVAYWHLFKRKK